MKTLGSIVTYKKGKPPKTGPHGRLPVLSPHYLRTGQIEEMAEPTSKDVVLSGGELILLWDGSNAGEFFRARAGVLSSTMVAFDFDQEETNPDYLYYDLKRFEPELKGRTAGSGIPHVDKEVLLARRVFDGGPDEQKAAAKVLLTVDRAIEQTEALLAKQQRIKTGLMHDLFTRGLDDQGQLRDPATHAFKQSRFGSIPETWTTPQLGEIAYILDPNPSHRYPQSCYQGVPIVSTENFAGEDDFDTTNATMVPQDVFVGQNQRCDYQPDDVIFARKGRMGFARPYGTETKVFSHTVVVIKSKGPSAHNSFLLWLLRSVGFFDELTLQMNSNSGVPTLGIQFIESLRVRLPLPAEQESIAKLLNQNGKAIRDTKELFQKLKALRRGLMDDLLTGRVPVAPLLANLKGPIFS